MEVQLYTEWADHHVCTSNLRVRREKLSAELSLMREIDVFSPQACDSRTMRKRWQVYNEIIYNAKEPYAMRTSVTNSQKS